MAGIRSWIDRRFPFSDFVTRNVTGYSEPRNLTYLWNFGSLAGLFLAVQVLTGVWLAMFYKPDVTLAFDSVQHIMRQVNDGWLIRYLHAAGAGFLFLAVYVHIGRNLYYGSYKPPRELLFWIGLVIYLCLMAEAFMGYLLPWGQMSFWSATVITSIFGTVPLVGQDLVVWLRGDYAVGNATLGRFFALHTTLLPVAIIGSLVVTHLVALRRVGSSNPEGVGFGKRAPESIPFAPYYVTRDLWFAALALGLCLAVVFFFPTWLLEPANSEPARPLVTPAHIVPEWYFLPFYAILRSVPSKFWGAVAMAASILILAFLPYLDRSPIRGVRHRPVKRALTWVFFLDVLALGWLGSRPPLGATLALERVATLVYFLFFAALPLVPLVEKGRPQEGSPP